MFQAEIHIQQNKECIVSHLATELDTEVDIYIEELHDNLVTFVLDVDDDSEAVRDLLADSPQVKHVEELGDGNYLITKRSCGAYEAIDRNHAVLRRRNFVGPNRRVYSVLFFRRQDLRAMIEEFRKVGKVTLGKLSEFDDSGVELTDRQYEVIDYALQAGYFEWPREITSEELASEMDISRTTLLEHLRKAESKLLTDALDSAGNGTDQPLSPEPVDPPK